MGGTLPGDFRGPKVILSAPIGISTCRSLTGLDWLGLAWTGQHQKTISENNHVLHEAAAAGETFKILVSHLSHLSHGDIRIFFPTMTRASVSNRDSLAGRGSNGPTMPAMLDMVFLVALGIRDPGRKALLSHVHQPMWLMHSMA